MSRDTEALSSILTLTPEAIGRLLLRHRRTETLERFEPQLDHFLRNILQKANEFVPSESGAILLDDPRAKLFGSADNVLTCIAAFGQSAERMLGITTPSNQGLAGEVYTDATATCRGASAERDSYVMDLSAGNVRSVLAVPVLVGTSVCGVLLMINGLATQEYSSENQSLLEIFAGYLSFSIQNILDGVRARELARRDHLTGLFNDRYFHHRLREELRRAAASSSSVALLFIDLDDFKRVNDRFGHLVGSCTLHELGLLLQSEAPPGAVSARYGGDEFVLILFDMDVKEAEGVADRIRRRIAAAGLIERDEEVTVSIGVAAYPRIRPGETAAEAANALIRAADAAMYRAKARGKNNVVVADDPSKEDHA